MVGPTNQPAVGHVVAGQEHRALRRRLVDVAADTRVGVGVDDRADLHPGRGGVADEELLGAPDEALDDRVVGASRAR